MNLKFDQIAEALKQAKIPCRLKETNRTEYIIELGMWYPDELVDNIYEAIPDFKGTICSESTGGAVVASIRLNGGPKNYF
jgi:hypothetical protein